MLLPKLRSKWKIDEASGSKDTGNVAKVTIDKGTHKIAEPTPCNIAFQATVHGSTSSVNKAIFHPERAIAELPRIMPIRGSNLPIFATAKKPNAIPAPREARRMPIMVSG